MNIIKSALGDYKVSGNPSEADCVAGHSFGTITGEGSANRAIVDFIVEHAGARPIVVDRMLVDEFPGAEQQIAHIVDGPISNIVGQGVGTWRVLVEVKAFMQREGLRKALMVAQKHHIGRVAMQADKLGIDYVIPANLPNVFDVDSDQVFTRSAVLWVPRELLGSLVLRMQGKL